MMKRGRSGGFSLIELLVVLVILGLLASVVGPQVMKHVGRAKTDSAKLQIEDLGAALDAYYLDTGSYPTSEQGLQALVEAPSGIPGWNGPYLRKKSIPRDPWGRDYHYVSPGAHGPYDLYTLGRDNLEGGDKDDRDVHSWD